ncbi:MAG: hypothetical protein U0W24_22095 [Bacteroidales bacterium]
MRKLLIVLFLLSSLVSTGQNNYVLTLEEEMLLDSLKSEMNDLSDNSLGIELSYSGYEAGNEEKWYYNQEGIIQAYHSSWSMEGTSGEEFDWFENGKLKVVYAETYGQSEEPAFEFITDKDGAELLLHQAEISGREAKLYRFIEEHQEQISDAGDSYLITVEEVGNFGVDVTITTQIIIDKELFNRQIKR